MGKEKRGRTEKEKPIKGLLKSIKKLIAAVFAMVMLMALYHVLMSHVFLRAERSVLDAAACRKNLRSIDAAEGQRKQGLIKNLVCLTGGAYTTGATRDEPVCSIGNNGTETKGDDHILGALDRQ